ncbi:hypothetical protein CAPGI0001_2058 [Capnocytophaga gingivalis ATCC 33624]|nr:hypothetical protein CAPGI0001_2058 [Capnocytophaga gingivalis ATCC 33624]
MSLNCNSPNSPLSFREGREAKNYFLCKSYNKANPLIV